MLRDRATRRWIGGFGILLHHMSACYVISGVYTHIFPLDRTLLATTLPLIVEQHAPVLLK